MQLGDFNLRSINAGFFKLDGGAMHGRVPKELWKKNFKSDRANRIRLATNCLLIETKTGQKILVDTGNGNKWDDKLASLYGIDPNYTIVDALKKRGVAPEDINLVINTHLHFDHAGGNTYGPSFKATFPQARYLCQKGEFEQAGLTLADQASYHPEDYRPLYESHQLEWIDGSKEVFPGICVYATPGHTAHHQSVVISSQNQSAIFFGDLVPTSFHVRIPYTMGYDLYPVSVIETKKELFQKIIHESWLVFWYHDSLHHAGFLEYDKAGKVRVKQYINVI